MLQQRGRDRPDLLEKPNLQPWRSQYAVSMGRQITRLQSRRIRHSPVLGTTLEHGYSCIIVCTHGLSISATYGMHARIPLRRMSLTLNHRRFQLQQDDQRCHCRADWQISHSQLCPATWNITMDVYSSDITHVNIYSRSVLSNVLAQEHLASRSQTLLDIIHYPTYLKSENLYTGCSATSKILYNLGPPFLINVFADLYYSRIMLVQMFL